MRGRFVDLSSWNPVNIDWQSYTTWARSFDNKARACLRASYGNGYKDQHYAAYRAAAEAAGIDLILHYHYAYSQYNTPIAEANWMATVIGNIRPTDIIMLDFEENVPQATSEWAYQWLIQQQKNYPNNQIIVYSFVSLILSRLQDSRLTQWPLILAKWEYSPDENPPCPPPWTHYNYLQYSDKESNIPGIPGTVDADVYITGEITMAGVPTGWKDDGAKLTAPNGVAVLAGFRQFILTSAWDADDYPLGPEVGVTVLEMSNPSLGGGTQQMFRCSMLGWNAQVGVIHEWIGTELVATRAALKDAQTQLSQCTATLKVTGQQLATCQTALAASQQGTYAKAALAARDLLDPLPPYPLTTTEGDRIIE